MLDDGIAYLLPSVLLCPARMGGGGGYISPGGDRLEGTGLPDPERVLGAVPAGRGRAAFLLDGAQFSCELWEQRDGRFARRFCAPIEPGEPALGGFGAPGIAFQDGRLAVLLPESREGGDCTRVLLLDDGGAVVASYEVEAPRARECRPERQPPGSHAIGARVLHVRPAAGGAALEWELEDPARGERLLLTGSASPGEHLLHLGGDLYLRVNDRRRSTIEFLIAECQNRDPPPPVPAECAVISVEGGRALQGAPFAIPPGALLRLEYGALWALAQRREASCLLRIPLRGGEVLRIESAPNRYLFPACGGRGVLAWDQAPAAEFELGGVFLEWWMGDFSAVDAGRAVRAALEERSDIARSPVEEPPAGSPAVDKFEYGADDLRFLCGISEIRWCYLRPGPERDAWLRETVEQRAAGIVQGLWSRADAPRTGVEDPEPGDEAASLRSPWSRADLRPEPGGGAPPAGFRLVAMSAAGLAASEADAAQAAVEALFRPDEDAESLPCFVLRNFLLESAGSLTFLWDTGPENKWFPLCAQTVVG